MANIAEELKSNGSIQTEVEVYFKLLKYGKEKGYISENASMPMIVELVSQSHSICGSIFNAMNEYYKKNGSNVLAHLNILFGWCIYMGLGITYRYNDNPEQLSVNEMCQQIIDERTIFAMDEYVANLIGMKYGSKESNEFVEHIQLLAQLCMLTISTSNEELFMTQVRYTSQALFDYGCAIEMSRLGM